MTVILTITIVIMMMMIISFSLFRRIPSIVEYLSFMFYPQGVLIGPIVYYANYSVFIEGTQHKVLEVNSEGKEVTVYREPSAAVSTYFLYFKPRGH